ncbi:MAG: type 4a pilus biogenesis protein PilO [Candidatus Omnitrophica bacterium]|nr:type 4a pilus biogenesis protein PilO [Candidatus Omnitrophota bacterium]
MEWEVPINRNKNKILNIIVIVIALFIANNIYKASTKTFDAVKEVKNKELEKNALLDNMGKLNKKINSYKNFLNKKDISLVINNISDIAKDSGVKIVMVRPEEEQASLMYVKYSFNFGIIVSDYKALGRFISKLESSSDVYIVDTINISPEFASEEGSLKGLTVSLKVSTFLFKDNRWK